MSTIGIIGVSGKLGQHLTRIALDRNHTVIGVCREQSVPKLGDLANHITIIPGHTNNSTVIQQAIPTCDAVLTVLVPWGMNQYASGTANAVLTHAKPDARLIFSCGWHVPGHPNDIYPRTQQRTQRAITALMRSLRIMDINDQVAAAQQIYASTTQWTVVRASTLKEAPSQGLPVWAEHVGHPMLASDLTPRIDYAHFMHHAISNDTLIQTAPAIVGRLTPSAKEHAHDRKNGDAELQDDARQEGTTESQADAGTNRMEPS